MKTAIKWIIGITGLLLVAVIALNAAQSEDDVSLMTAKRHVAALMKDPDSAKFSGIFLVKEPANKDGFQSINICGIVDAKNSFGAYTGGSRFIAKYLVSKKDNIRDNSYIEIEPSDRRATNFDAPEGKRETVFERVYWNVYCADSTHPKSFTGEVPE